MSLIHAFVQQVRHPACQPTPFKLSELVLRLGILISLLVVGFTLWPSVWWILGAFILGLALITHPGCLISGRSHKPGHHWFGLEKRHN